MGKETADSVAETAFTAIDSPCVAADACCIFAVCAGVGYTGDPMDSQNPIGLPCVESRRCMVTVVGTFWSDVCLNVSVTLAAGQFAGGCGAASKLLHRPTQSECPQFAPHSDGSVNVPVGSSTHWPLVLSHLYLPTHTECQDRIH
jgi:hypothetical protein